MLGTLDSLLLRYAEEMEGGPELSGLLFGFSCERPLDFIAVECQKISAALQIEGGPYRVQWGAQVRPRRKGD